MPKSQVQLREPSPATQPGSTRTPKSKPAKRSSATSKVAQGTAACKANLADLMAWRWCERYKPSIEFSSGANVPTTIVLYDADNLQGEGSTLAEAVADLIRAAKKNRTPYKK